MSKGSKRRPTEVSRKEEEKRWKLALRKKERKTMKKIILVIVITMITSNSYAAIKYVKGYFKSDGTYVSGHYKDTSGDGNKYNNASSLGLNKKNI